jgi:hypothetical protein
MNGKGAPNKPVDIDLSGLDPDQKSILNVMQQKEKDLGRTLTADEVAAQYGAHSSATTANKERKQNSILFPGRAGTIFSNLLQRK